MVVKYSITYSCPLRLGLDVVVLCKYECLMTEKVHFPSFTDVAFSYLLSFQRCFFNLNPTRVTISKLCSLKTLTYVDFEIEYQEYKKAIQKNLCKTATLKRQKIGFQDQLSLNAGQKYCRMLQGEHSAILSTFIKRLFVI